eukprot:Pompholyxophrys_punicea_v1_NODE_454_length_1917_cov_181.552872.p2 type:complete len:100 gc:universal NODE_454_length_1917_cov_181.552872:415-116(-)
MTSLKDYFKKLRDQFDHHEKHTRKFCLDNEYEEVEKRIKKRSTKHYARYDGTAKEVVLVGRDNFRVTVFISIVDSLTVEIAKRADSYTVLHSKFSFCAT